MSATLNRVRALVEVGDYLVSVHGYEELDEDGIVAEDLVTSLDRAEMVEDYPDAGRGPSVLALHRLPGGEVVHVVWGLPAGRLAPAVIVTAYRPDPARWSPDWRTRRR